MWRWLTKYMCQTTQLLTLLSWNSFTPSVRLKLLFKWKHLKGLLFLLEWLKYVSRIYNWCILSVNYWFDGNVGLIEFTKTPKTGACGFTWHLRIHSCCYFRRVRKAAKRYCLGSSCVSVRPPETPTRPIFVKFYIGNIHQNVSIKFKFG